MGKKHGTLTKSGKVSLYSTPPTYSTTHPHIGQKINAKSEKEMWGRINQKKMQGQSLEKNSLH